MVVVSEGSDMYHDPWETVTHGKGIVTEFERLTEFDNDDLI